MWDMIWTSPHSVGLQFYDSKALKEFDEYRILHLNLNINFLTYYNIN